MKRLLTLHDFLNMPEEDIREYQDRKFSAYVKHQLYYNSPYFRRLFGERGVDPEDINGIEDWQKAGLPLITKAVYRENLSDMILNPWEVDGEKRTLRQVAENYVRFQKEVGDLDKRFLSASLPQKDIYSCFDLEDTETLEGLIERSADSPESERKLKQAMDYIYSPLTVFFTGGSTGLPTPITQTSFDRDLYKQSTIIMMYVAGSDWLMEKAGKVVAMSIYPYAPHQGWWVTAWGAEGSADFFISTSGGGVLPVESLILMLARFQVNMVTGMPGYVRNRFLKKALEMRASMGLEFPDHMVFNLGGEKIVPRVRNEMQEMLHKLGVKEMGITGAWGASETRFNLLGECDCFSETGYHSTGFDKVAYRIVKMESVDDWEFAEPGEEGYVVQFPMDGAGTLIEGFLLGDKAVRLPGACPVCGSHVERFVNPLRANEVDAQLMVMGLVEQKVKGASVNLTDLRSQLMEIPEINELQVVISKEDPSDPASRDLLRINANPVDDLAAAEEELVENIKSKAKSLSEVSPEVRLMDIDSLLGEGLKFKAIVDERS